MRRRTTAPLIAAAMLLAGIAAKADLVAEVPPPGVAAPARQDLPDGPGKAVVTKLCAGCHDLMFTLTTRETEEGWTRVINDMRSRGTDGTEEEFQEVIAYLTVHMGKAERPSPRAALELVANRTRVSPGERFAVGLRLVPAAGWRLKDGPASEPSPKVSWTTPEAISIGDPASPVADAPVTFAAFPAVVSGRQAPGSTLGIMARVAYEVCRETCVAETATVSLTLAVGDGGMPSHEAEFARAGVALSR